MDVDDLYVEKFIDGKLYEYKGQTKEAVVHKEVIKIKGRDEPFIEEVIEVCNRIL